MNPEHLLRYVIAPTLDRMTKAVNHADSHNARALVLGTGLIESDLSALRQHGNGPAGGIYQCEPETHSDIWENYLNHRPGLYWIVLQMASARACGASLAPGLIMHPSHDELYGNLPYATAICRVHYLRVPHSLPEDPQEMASYYKRYYNTTAGASSIEGSIPYFERAIRIVNGGG